MADAKRPTLKDNSTVYRLPMEKEWELAADHMPKNTGYELWGKRRIKISKCLQEHAFRRWGDRYVGQRLGMDKHG